jgi:hypothetical protein
MDHLGSDIAGQEVPAVVLPQPCGESIEILPVPFDGGSAQPLFVSGLLNVSVNHLDHDVLHMVGGQQIISPAPAKENILLVNCRTRKTERDWFRILVHGFGILRSGRRNVGLNREFIVAGEER